MIIRVAGKQVTIKTTLIAVIIETKPASPVANVDV